MNQKNSRSSRHGEMQCEYLSNRNLPLYGCWSCLKWPTAQACNPNHMNSAQHPLWGDVEQDRVGSLSSIRPSLHRPSQVSGWERRVFIYSMHATYLIELLSCSLIVHMMLASPPQSLFTKLRTHCFVHLRYIQQQTFQSCSGRRHVCPTQARIVSSSTSKWINRV